MPAAGKFEARAIARPGRGVEAPCARAAHARATHAPGGKPPPRRCAACAMVSAAVEVGDRPRHPQDAVIAAGAELQLLRRPGAAGRAPARRRAATASSSSPSASALVRTRRRPRPRQPVALQLRARRPPAPPTSALPSRGAGSAISATLTAPAPRRAGRCGPAAARRCAPDSRRRSAAPARRRGAGIVEMAAAARVHGRDQLEARGIGDVGVGARDA